MGGGDGFPRARNVHPGLPLPVRREIRNAVLSKRGGSEFRSIDAMVPRFSFTFGNRYLFQRCDPHKCPLRSTGS